MGNRTRLKTGASYRIHHKRNGIMVVQIQSPDMEVGYEVRNLLTGEYQYLLANLILSAIEICEAPGGRSRDKELANGS
jgi:hypothetical protein